MENRNHRRLTSLGKRSHFNVNNNNSSTTTTGTTTTVGQSTAPAASASTAPTLTPAQMHSNFEEWIKLCTDNVRFPPLLRPQRWARKVLTQNDQLYRKWMQQILGILPWLITFMKWLLFVKVTLSTFRRLLVLWMVVSRFILLVSTQ